MFTNNMGRGNTDLRKRSGIKYLIALTIAVCAIIVVSNNLFSSYFLYKNPENRTEKSCIGNSDEIDHHQARVIPATKAEFKYESLPEDYNEQNNCPSFCGHKFDFEPFDPLSSRTQEDHLRRTAEPFTSIERAVGSKTIFRLPRPDLLERVAEAVEEIDRNGGFESNSYCSVFDSCEAKDPMQSRHSQTYLVCDGYRRVLASNILQGVARTQLPGFLKEKQDANVLCEMAKYVSEQATKLIFPSIGWNDQKCVVQEFFVNQQRSGSLTNRHIHPDDSYGGIFYLDVPEGTKFCFSNESWGKGSWLEYAPELTEDLFPDAPDKDYPGYVEPRAGDILLAPVGWLKHWVPKMTIPPGQKRTSVVFNMICF